MSSPACFPVAQAVSTKSVVLNEGIVRKGTQTMHIASRSTAGSAYKTRKPCCLNNHCKPICISCCANSSSFLSRVSRADCAFTEQLCSNGPIAHNTSVNMPSARPARLATASATQQVHHCSLTTKCMLCKQLELLSRVSRAGCVFTEQLCSTGSSAHNVSVNMPSARPPLGPSKPGRPRNRVVRYLA